MTCKKNQPDEQPYACLRKGVAIGKNLKMKIEPALSKDVIRDIARLNRIAGYSRMSKMQMLQALEQAGITHFKPFSLGQASL